MTALTEYDRLEATGLWRASADAQRLDVYVFVGTASLVIADKTEAPLAHWSLPAIERLNPGQRPALFAPLPDADETLEIDDQTMIEAIERVQRAVRAGEPHPGRLRMILAAVSVLLVGALLVFWLPGAVIRHAASVIPPAQSARLGAQILDAAETLTGPPCSAASADRDLAVLARAVLPDDPPTLIVVRDGVDGAVALPGGTILMNARLLEDHETADVAAGHVLAAFVGGNASRALTGFLSDAGTWPTIRLLTTGDIPDAALTGYATGGLLRAAPAPDHDTLVAAFRDAGLSTAPYAQSQKLAGRPHDALLRDDPFPDGTAPMVLSDNTWIRLQSVCLN